MTAVESNVCSLELVPDEIGPAVQEHPGPWHQEEALMQDQPIAFVRLCACGCGASLAGKRRDARFLDKRHRERAYYHRGDGPTPAVHAEAFIASVYERIDFGPHPSGCWLWTGAQISTGYGHLRLPNGDNALAHRFIYEHRVGPIPEGLWLDHVRARGCTSTLCVNPEHLEPVPPRVNTLRGDLPEANTARAAAQSYCKRGHPRTPENVRRDKRGCGTCRVCEWLRRQGLV